MLSEITHSRLSRAFFFSVMALVLAVLLGACGFRPLYGKHGAGVLPAEEYLARIEIQQLKDRVGQQLRNNLLSRLSPRGSSGKPLYSLGVNVSESITSLGVKKSAVVTRGNLMILANYSLTFLRGAVIDTEESAESKQGGLTSGTVLSTSSYDIPQAQYAASAALKDARTRAVKEISDEIRTRLAAYFKQ
ncbi:MAG: hypothetical protein HQ513_01985, partial [Rhodospirillales bacterium]|nr:hypothetical protein [Rhodospirillales bacterium]